MIIHGWFLLVFRFDYRFAAYHQEETERCFWAETKNGHSKNCVRKGFIKSKNAF